MKYLLSVTLCLIMLIAASSLSFAADYGESANPSSSQTVKSSDHSGSKEQSFSLNSHLFYVSVKLGALAYVKALFPYLQEPARILAQIVMVVSLLWFFGSMALFGSNAKDVIKTLVALFMMAGILALIDDVSTFEDMYMYFTTSIEEIAGFFIMASKAGGTSLSAAEPIKTALGILDNFFVQIYDWSEKMVTASAWKDTWLWLQQVLAFVLVFGFYVAMYIKFLFVLGRSVMSIILLFIFAPFTSVMAAFKFTRGITLSWMKSIITFALLIITSSMVMGMGLFFITRTADMMTASTVNSEGLSNALFDGPAFSLILGCGLIFILLHYVNEIVTNLGGARTTGSLSTGMAALAGASVGLGKAAAMGMAAKGVSRGWGSIKSTAGMGMQKAMGVEGYRAYSSFKSRAGAFTSGGTDQFGNKAYMPGYQTQMQKQDAFNTQTEFNKMRKEDYLQGKTVQQYTPGMGAAPADAVNSRRTSSPGESLDAVPDAVKSKGFVPKGSIKK